MKGRVLDGHINRCLEGRTIDKATKDGRLLTLWMTNGERWSIAWANPETGEGVMGEPRIVKVDVSVVAPPVGMFGVGGAA
jgi:hypothetical protein